MCSSTSSAKLAFCCATASSISRSSASSGTSMPSRSASSCAAVVSTIWRMTSAERAGVARSSSRKTSLRLRAISPTVMTTASSPRASVSRLCAPMRRPEAAASVAAAGALAAGTGFGSSGVADCPRAGAASAASVRNAASASAVIDKPLVLQALARLAGQGLDLPLVIRHLDRPQALADPAVARLGAQDLELLGGLGVVGREELRALVARGRGPPLVGRHALRQLLARGALLGALGRLLLALLEQLLDAVLEVV